MSDNYLRLIPADPEFQPLPGALDDAMQLLNQLVPLAAERRVRQGDEVQFVDQGENFERVLCPHCGNDLTDQWLPWMETSSQSRFVVRTIVLPCCSRHADLNDLEYKWPAGFAKAILELENPDPAEFLDSEALKNLERLLRCKIRQVLAHY
ncbi:MAG: hypothetical protein ABI972_05505 [Acidobacteriota bacterium]